MIDAVDAVALVRLSTILIGIYVLSLTAIKHHEIRPASPTPITVLVVESVQPRRALILSLLLFIAFTYFLDGLVLIAVWLLKGWRQSDLVEWRGIELADSAGLVAFIGLIFIGIGKDRKGIEFWPRKRVKFLAFATLAFDIAYLVLMVITVPIFKKPAKNPQIPEMPYKAGLYLPNFFHFLALSIRIALVLVLLIALFRPIKSYSTVHRQGVSPNASTTLLPSQGITTHPEYGTFAAVIGESRDRLDTKDLHVAGEEDTTRAETSQHRSPPDKAPTYSSQVVDEPLGRDPAIEDVPNPVTDDPEALKNSYAAVAAKALDKEEAATSHDHAATAQEPVAFPGGGRDSPLGFATRDDTSSVRGVTFTPDANTSPSKADLNTPEGEAAEKKRKRISSQNLQKLVRRISLVPKRTGSISSVGSKPDSLPGSATKPGFFRRSREEGRASGEGSSYSGTLPDDASVGEGGEGQQDAGKGKSKKSKRKSLKI